VVKIALQGAEQVLMREVDAKAHSETLDKLAAQL
jgi:F0F1-type ATP synthase membrane subunit b/b'